MSPNRKKHAAIYGKPKTGDPAINDYQTGKPSAFYIRNGDSHDRIDKSACGPEFKTPQWIRTIK